MAGISIRAGATPRFGRSGQENDVVSSQWASPYPYGLTYTFGDHAKSVVQLQKKAFLDGDIGRFDGFSADALQPYAMGLDKETYNRVVAMPVTFMGIVFALLMCTMFTRWKQGKPVHPWSCCDGYSGVSDGGSAAGRGDEGAGSGRGSDFGGGPTGSARSATSAASGGPSAAAAPRSGSAGPAAGSSAGAPPSAAGGAAEKPKEKKELPYERIPTPGVTPYVWSPPATIFQPSPTPPGTPFVGSPSGGGAAAESSDDIDEGYMKMPQGHRRH